MKRLILVLLVMSSLASFSQTRKTRKDKGGTHKHSGSYYTKKAVKDATKPKKTKTKKSKK